MAKRVLILGSTGSIGVQALEVISETPGLEVAGLAAKANDELLAQQARDFDCNDLAIISEEAAARLQAALPESRVIAGPGAIGELVRASECDLVLNAVVGAAGLEATMATIDKGVDLALANKESLVVGGELVMTAARDKGVAILPVDSEHSAIFQCLQGQGENRPDRLYLTASGGPFFGYTAGQLASVTLEEALRHPRWQMGSKITIDSATLMNKGLEIIEAHYLFAVPYDEIEVLVHPQSIVHSLVRFADGSALAQLGLPSMKLPIAYALNYPERLPVTAPQLDLAAEGELNFHAPDPDAFPCLRLAREAGERGGGAPVALNAANEVAVAAFLDGRLGFTGIAATAEKTLTAMDAGLPSRLQSLVEVAAIDAEARQRAEEAVGPA